MEYELTGTHVLVHPGLYHDPSEKQGQIGKVSKADLQSDTITVNFKNGGSGNYESNALLVLKESREIYPNVLFESRNLDTADFKAIMEISLLQQSRLPGAAEKALEIASKKAAVREFTTVSAEEKFGLRPDQLMDASNSVTVGR